MAAVMRQLPASLVKKHLTCPICGDLYKNPRRLPCDHVMCHGCLEEKISRVRGGGAWSTCPDCHMTTELPVGGIGALPAQDFIAKLCKLTDESRDSDLMVSDFNCLQHHEECSLLCTECQVIICTRCTRGQHRGHSWVMCTEAVEAGSDHMRTLQDDQRRHLVDITKAADDLREYERDLRTGRRQAMAEVRQRANVIRSVLNQLEANLLDEIETYYLSDHNRVSLQLRHLDWAISNIEQVKSLTSDLIHSVRDQRILYWDSLFSEETQRQIEELSRGEAKHLCEQPLRVRHTLPEQQHTEEAIKSLMGGIVTTRNPEGFLDADTPNTTFIGYGVIEDTPSEFSEETTEILLTLHNNWSEKQHPIDKCSSTTVGIGIPTLVENIGNNCVTTTVGVGLATIVPTSRPCISPVSSIGSCDIVAQFSTFTDKCENPPFNADVICLENDDVVVSDVNNKCIKYFRQGILYRVVHTTSRIWGLCNIGKDGLAITDRTVHLFDARGRVVQVLRQHPRDCRGLALNSEGAIVLTDMTSRSVYVVSIEDGSLKTLFTGCNGREFISPNYVTCSSNGDIIISDSDADSVYLLNSMGEFLASIAAAGDQSLNKPGGVCTTSDGNIIICDTNNDRLVIVDDTLSYIKSISHQGTLYRPQSITTDSYNNLVVCETDGIIKLFNL